MPSPISSRQRLFASLLSIILLGAAFAAPVAEKRWDPIGDTIDLGYAKYQGTILKDIGINQYLGMRFADSPVGDNRFRAPQPPTKQTEVQQATQYGPVCAGVGTGLSTTVSEDCLYVSVYTPTNATQDSKLPVWFFIGGGGYAGDSDPNFNGTGVLQASENNIIFVEFNYRVGLFGFLASQKVKADGDLNAGLLDQKAAIAWTQKYINLFGGDPDRIVIHGVSAGAGSVVLHLLAYGGKGSNSGIVGAMVESPFLPTHRTVAESEFQFDRLSSAVDCSSSSDELNCLRSKDSATLQAQDIVQTYPGAPADVLPDWYWLPVIDGDFSQDYVYNQLEKGEFMRVPLLVGDDNDEGTGFTPALNSSQDFRDFIQANYPKLTSDDLDKIGKAYPLEGSATFPTRTAWFSPGAAAYGEATFTCFGNEIGKAYAQYVGSDKSWNYHYNVTSTSLTEEGLGIPHVSEKPAVFGPDNQNSAGGSYLTYNAPIVPVIQGFFTSFVRSLNPNTHKYSEAPTWDPLGSDGNARFKFQLNDNGMETIPSDQDSRCSLWKSLATVSEQ